MGITMPGHDVSQIEVHNEAPDVLAKTTGRTATVINVLTGTCRGCAGSGARFWRNAEGWCHRVVRAAGMAINPDGCAERTSTTDTTRSTGQPHHLCLPVWDTRRGRSAIHISG
jgi:hypothetical protein